MGGLSTVWSLEPKVSLQRWMKLVGDFLVGPVLLAAVGRGFATDTARAWTTRIALWGGAGALAVLATHSLSGGAFLVALGLKAPHPDPQIMFAATSPAATVIAVFAAPVALLVYRRYGIWSSWWIEERAAGDFPLGGGREEGAPQPSRRSTRSRR
jgi:hypothetical protein